MRERLISLETNRKDAPRAHYESVVYSTLRMLWKHKPIVAAVLVIALSILSVALMVIAPRYTGEATIQIDFTRGETVAGERVQSTAAVDAAAVVDSAARIIRSRATASAVVSALGLDNDPAYTHRSSLARMLSALSIFKLSTLTSRDLAVTHLMKQIAVTNDPRSYLITIAVTTHDPESAARLANWVASEYLRGRLRDQSIAAYAVAEREVATLASVFGPRHPSYLSARAKLEHLRAELSGTREEVVAKDRQAVVAPEMIRFAAGQSLLPAEVVMTPSGPNAMLLLVLTIIGALAVGVVLSLLVENRWSVRIPVILR